MEEKVARIPIKGIMRNASIAQIEDGGCDEIINLRFKEGSWRPISGKTQVATLPYYSNAKYYKHNVDYTYDVYLIYKPGTPNNTIVSYINGVESSALVTFVAASETFVSFSHIDNYLIVWTNINKYILFWDTDAYTVLPNLPNIEMFVGQDSQRIPIMAPYSSYAEALATYLEQMSNYKTLSGLYEGIVIIMAAFKLFDGTYVKHSQPYYLLLGNIDTHQLPVYLERSAGFYRILGGYGMTILGVPVGCPTVQFKFTNTDITNLASYKGLVQSIDVFCSYPKSIYDVPTSDPSEGADGAYPFLATNDEFANDTILNYYLIKSFHIDNVDNTTETTITLPNPTDFQAETTLAVDNYSNHKIICNRNTNYNSRQHLGDITTVLGNGHNPFANGVTDDYLQKYCDDLHDLSYEEKGTTLLKMISYLRTDSGDKIVSQDITVSYYDATPGVSQKVILKPFVSYPDIRCYKIEIYVRDTSPPYAYSRWINFEINPHKIHNYSYKYTEYYGGDSTHVHSIFKSPYYDKPVYGTDYAGYSYTPEELAAMVLPTADIYMSEPNRLQLSAINNPLYLPSINSYKVGNVDDVIYGIAPSVAPVSENQFGQYPVFVFTKGAIYAMMVGENDVVYSSIIPVTNEIFNSSSQFLPVRNGVVYTCPRGLKYIEGRTVLDIDNFIREYADRSLVLDTAFSNILNAPPTGNTVTLLNDSISNLPFLTYLSAAKLAFDNKENELILSYPTMDGTGYLYPYNYVYNFLANAWHKTSNAYSDFISAFPGSLGLTKDGSSYDIYDMSSESASGSIDAIIVTRPVKLNGSGFKKLTGGFVRCDLVGRTSPVRDHAFYVYGSVDGKVWKYISGKKITNTEGVFDIGINKHNISCRYYIFVIAGHLYYRNNISYIDAQYADIANNKLR